MSKQGRRRQLRDSNINRATLCGLLAQREQRIKELEDRLAEFSQLADEMQESDSGPFPDRLQSDGWSAARNFYAREIRAIAKEKAPKIEASP